MSNWVDVNVLLVEELGEADAIVSPEVEPEVGGGLVGRMVLGLEGNILGVLGWIFGEHCC